MSDYCKDCPWLHACGKEDLTIERGGKIIVVKKDEYPCHGTLEDIFEVKEAIEH